ncbi:STAS domain-containing protein [Streptomyces johnsoniae]|uniref:STAS domain-containing protein n=1 Tax=Streptomyces johnsoniae TaxID=3075532 RepID=A0ABU2SDP8_9ACTN|nr:STAS domain-containing protein [Streptomyces sp. DSM 41886]MDT0447073.1 STAS domain-containing protein [Streptomyces sp. DSM 41886]
MHVDTYVRGNTASISPHCDIDIHTLPQVEAAFAALPPTVTDVTLDLADAPFMDIAGLHLLVGARRTALARHGTLTVTGLSPQPHRLLQVAQRTFPGTRFGEFLPGGVTLTV